MTTPTIKTNYRFTNITEPVKESIKLYVERNLNGKLDSYLKHIVSKSPDVEVYLHVDIEKDKMEKFVGHFKFDVPGMDSYNFQRTYDNLDDLVNHAFDHFKQKLSDKN